MTLGQPADRPSDTSPPVGHFRNTVLSWHKGMQLFMNLSNQLKEKYKLSDTVIETALGRPLGFLSRVRNGKISHPDYYYNFDAYCKKLSELLSEHEKRETNTQPSPVDSTTHLRRSFRQRYRAASDTKPAIVDRIQSTFLWQFPEEWFSLPYTEAMATCTTAFDASYVQGIAKIAQYNITKSSELAGINRKHFGKLFNKYDGTASWCEFAPEDLSRPFSELKREWIDDFKKQYIARAIDKSQTLTGASKSTGIDRKHLRLTKRRLIDVPNDSSAVEE